MNASMIGFDISKSLFSRSMARVRGKDRSGEALAARAGREFLCQTGSGGNWDRGLWFGASLSSNAARARPWCAADPGRLCEAFRQAQQERCARCGSDLCCPSGVRTRGSKPSIRNAPPAARSGAVSGASGGSKARRKRGCNQFLAGSPSSAKQGA